MISSSQAGQKSPSNGAAPSNPSSNPANSFATVQTKPADSKPANISVAPSIASPTAATTTPAPIAQPAAENKAAAPSANADAAKAAGEKKEDAPVKEVKFGPVEPIIIPAREKDEVKLERQQSGYDRRDRLASDGDMMDSGDESGEKKRKQQNKPIDNQHPEFELTYDMMLGIGTMVGRVEAGCHRPLHKADFLESKSSRFPSRGSSTTPGHQMRDFKFKDYAPEVFRKLRHRWGVDPADYLLCLCGDFHFLEFISNSKSGQFFFYTHNRQFMIKTQSQAESKFLRHILPQYYEHMTTFPNTLLTRYYGMHRVKPHRAPAMHFVIMGNVFFTHKYVHEVYDLKGSTYGRAAAEKEKQQAVPILKDLDFLKNKVKVRLRPEHSKAMLEQLEKDVQFLNSLKIMDYSLLVGIHYRDRPTPYSRRQQADHRQSDGKLAVIDEKQQTSPRTLQAPIKRRQSNYGLRVKDDIISSPAVANFPSSSIPTIDAHHIEIELKEASAKQSANNNKVKETRLPGADEPIFSLFTREDGGIYGAPQVTASGTVSRSNTIYYVGLIDILQEYNVRKRVEHFVKTFKHDEYAISAVPSWIYAERFMEFIRHAIE